MTMPLRYYFVRFIFVTVIHVLSSCLRNRLKSYGVCLDAWMVDIGSCGHSEHKQMQQEEA